MLEAQEEEVFGKKRQLDELRQEETNLEKEVDEVEKIRRSWSKPALGLRSARTA